MDVPLWRGKQERKGNCISGNIFLYIKLGQSFNETDLHFEQNYRIKIDKKIKKALCFQSKMYYFDLVCQILLLKKEDLFLNLLSNENSIIEYVSKIEKQHGN